MNFVPSGQPNSILYDILQCTFAIKSNLSVKFLRFFPKELNQRRNWKDYVKKSKLIKFETYDFIADQITTKSQKINQLYWDPELNSKSCNTVFVKNNGIQYRVFHD